MTEAMITCPKCQTEIKLTESLVAPIIESAIEQTYKSIKTVLEKARSKSFKAVNTMMVRAYWHVGKIIIENEQRVHSGLNMAHLLSKSFLKD